MKIILGALVLTLVSFAEMFPQSIDRSAARFIFYNVENLFDTHDDTLKDDDEFLPYGIRGWNYSRYRQKINSLYKVFVAAGNTDPPAIIGMCEVENELVVKDLISSTYLSHFPYSYIHEDSEDERGIDVCLIYRSDIVRIDTFRYIYPRALRDLELKTRNILYVKLILCRDTIHLFLNHWPSRRGGVLAGEPGRKIISAALRVMVDSIAVAGNGSKKIIIAGDFNAVPEDEEILRLTGKDSQEEKSVSLVNLASSNNISGAGTYKYQGRWEMIDQIIVSMDLIAAQEGVFTRPSCFKPFDPAFLLVRDNTYTGLMPFSTYRGYDYLGGFSDHLPVILDLLLR